MLPNECDGLLKALCALTGLGCSGVCNFFIDMYLLYIGHMDHLVCVSARCRRSVLLVRDVSMCRLGRLFHASITLRIHILSRTET